jgi:glycosyltransferase involved in cell wall biosynthesis
MLSANDRKRVLIVDNGAIAVDDAGRRYVNNHTGQFACDIRHEGCELVFIAPHTPYDENGQLYNFCLQDQGLESRLLVMRPRFRASLAADELLREILKSDFVYIFFPGTLGKVAGLLCSLLRKPYGLYVRGGRFRETRLDRRVVRKAVFALTVSPALQQQIEPLCGSAGVIRPMVTITPEDAFARPAWVSRPPVWELLFVGRLEVDKGIRELIEAAEALRLKGVPFRLRLVGGGPLFHELSARLKDEPLGLNIEMAGLVSGKSDLMRFYQKAHIFIFPSYHEGFPRVLYEAMINSLPIVTTMVGGISGRMADGENCIGIPAKSAGSIVEAVERVTGDLRLLQAIGQAGQKTVLDVLEKHQPHSRLFTEHLKNHGV